MRELAGAAFLDRDVAHAVENRPIDGRIGQADIEGHAVVVRRQRLEVGTDLVADVAAARRAVGPGDDEVDLIMLHQVAAGIVGDHGMRHAVLSEFPGGQAGALIARSRLVDPDVNRNAGIVRLVDRRQRRAPVDGGEPACIAMGEGIDAPAFVAWLQFTDEAQPVFADAAANLGILVADLGGAAVGGLAAVGGRQRRQQCALVVERPAQVDRRGPRLQQHRVGTCQHRIGRIGRHGERHAVGRGGADQRGAANDHGADRRLGILHRVQVAHDEAMGQQGLVDRLDGRAVAAKPDGSIGGAVYFHPVILDGARHRVDYRRRIEPVSSIEVGNVAGLAELLHAERHDPLPPYRSQPRQRQRMAVHHRHDARIARQGSQQPLHRARRTVDQARRAATIPLRGKPVGMEPVG